MAGRIVLILTSTLILAAAAGRGLAADPEPAVGGQLFRFFDKDRSGKLEAAEFNAAPPVIRQWLASQGYSADKPISRDEFLKLAPQLLAALRGTAAKAATTAKPTPADAKKVLVNGQPEQTVSQATATAALPARYQELDVNFDGQIDFYEWRQKNRGKNADFANIDLNADGMLSLAELGYAETGQVTQVTQTPASTSSAGNSSSAGSTTAQVDPNKYDRSKPEGLAAYYFDYMDMNKSGVMEPGEWAVSRRIKPMFEKAGLDLKKNMTKADFIKHYVKISADSSRDRRRR